MTVASASNAHWHELPKDISWVITKWFYSMYGATSHNKTEHLYQAKPVNLLNHVKVPVATGGFQLPRRAPSQSRRGIAGIRTTPDRVMHLEGVGNYLFVCRLDHSVSPFKNAAFLGEEIFPVSFSHHCRPGIIWQWEWATFLEQPQFASLSFSLLANGKQVARTLHVQRISGLIEVSVLSHTDLVVLLPMLLI